MISKPKLFFSAGIGAALECYDFMICAFMSTILLPLFFPGKTFLGLFAIFTIAFFSRPLGGMFWGHLGDRYGRRRVFSLTMLLLVFPTLGMAMFPVHSVSVEMSSLSFILLRFLQGFLVGGEFSGGVTFIAELATSERRGATVASFMTALTLGTLLASLAALLLNSVFSKPAILAWAWRLPFLLSVALILVAIYIRKKAVETPYFQSLVQRSERSSAPLLILFKEHYFSVLKGFVLTSASAAILVTIYLYFPQLLKNHPHFHSNTILLLTTLGSFFLIICMPFAGILADHFGRKKIFVSALVLATLTLGLFYIAIQRENLSLLFCAMLFTSIFFAGVNANYATLLSELFPTRVRFSGVAVCYNLGYALCGGILPLVYAHFSGTLGLFTLPIALFVLITIFSVAALSKMAHMHRKNLL